MARLLNDQSEFASEFIEGFVAAHPTLVRQVPGGVARAAATEPGHVAVVIGGGSGHYPAFGGLVGTGLAHGAAMGNIFASPSAQQVYSVARSVNAGGGILLTYGNYMGDVLNFTAARDRLRSEGIPCEMVVVTDDISSAPVDQMENRRGIAGDFVVFKAAGASADAGCTLQQVTAAAHAANQRTRSFGVAFSGVVLPGSTQPLFSVADGRMAVGMGIHGEPGLGEVDLPTADELAQLLTATLLDERPDCAPTTSGARVAVVLNGLGSVKHEELFVVYRRISQLLNDAGVTIVEPEVGELITSFEMAGVSLTLAWLDAELERGWTADAMTPAFRRGTGMLVPPAGAAYPQVGATDPLPVPETNQPDGTIASTDAARVVLDCLRAMSRTIDHNVEELGQLDAIAGDGDHGIGMQRGSIAAAAAAEAAVEHGAGAGTTLARAADAWSDRAGGTSGLLWGILLAQLGLALGDQDRPGIAEFARGIEAGEREVVRFGKARIGDKTMVDVLSPFAESLAESARSGLDIVNALTIAAGVAEDAAKATADLIPLIGRARPHAEKSLGTPDPGARSLALLIRAVQNVLLERKRKQ